MLAFVTAWLALLTGTVVVAQNEAVGPQTNGAKSMLHTVRAQAPQPQSETRMLYDEMSRLAYR
jgi:hypothetical protein